jgi:hypothetical protein
MSDVRELGNIVNVVLEQVIIKIKTRRPYREGGKVQRPL